MWLCVCVCVCMGLRRSPPTVHPSPTSQAAGNKLSMISTFSSAIFAVQVYVQQQLLHTGTGAAHDMTLIWFRVHVHLRTA